MHPGGGVFSSETFISKYKEIKVFIIFTQGRYYIYFVAATVILFAWVVPLLVSFDIIAVVAGLGRFYWISIPCPVNYIRGGYNYFMAILQWQNLKKRFYSTIEKEIVEVKEKPFKVALGCSMGIAINFIPTLGIGFIFAFLLAVIFRINRASATVTSLLTGPLVPLMYALNFVVGGLILSPALGEESITAFIVRQYAIILQLGNIQDKILSSLELFGFTFLLGAAVNAVLFGTGFYFLVIFLIKKYKV